MILFIVSILFQRICLITKIGFFSCCISFAWAALPQKVIICGVCKNVEETFVYTKEILEEIGDLFADYRVIVYENNSSDKTVFCLNQWAESNAKVHVTSEYLRQDQLEAIVVNKTKDGQLFRPELIARARNIVLEKALTQEYEDFPYIIWVDMDFSIRPNLEGLIEVFTTDREWDAVFAYGIAKTGEYWDWYAARYLAFPFGPELLGNAWYQMAGIREKSISLKRDSDWFPVYSAFGGCGIYKKSSIRGCRYSALVTEDMEKLTRQLIDEGLHSGCPQALLYQAGLQKTVKCVKVALNKKVINPHIGIILFEQDRPVIWRMNTFTYTYPSVCEHVPFHASMIVRGHGKLFINPRLVFTYGAFE